MVIRQPLLLCNKRTLFAKTVHLFETTALLKMLEPCLEKMKRRLKILTFSLSTWTVLKIEELCLTNKEPCLKTMKYRLKIMEIVLRQGFSFIGLSTTLKRSRHCQTQWINLHSLSSQRMTLMFSWTPHQTSQIPRLHRLHFQQRVLSKKSFPNFLPRQHPSNLMCTPSTLPNNDLTESEWSLPKSSLKWWPGSLKTTTTHWRCLRSARRPDSQNQQCLAFWNVSDVVKISQRHGRGDENRSTLLLF